MAVIYIYLNYSLVLKKKSSSNSAIYTVRSMIEYFTKHGSTVIVGVLDITKAFDKVIHHGLFL